MLYQLHTQQPGRSARRLSPTAIRNTGTLQCNGMLAKTPVTSVADPEPHTGDSVDAASTVMPVDSKMDATEPQAGGKAPPSGDDGDSSPTSAPSGTVGISKSPTRDTYTSNDNLDAMDCKTRCHLIKSKLEETFAEARSHLTDAKRKQINKRMERIFPNDVSDYDTPDRTQDKGKGADPQNWGDVNLTKTELDPQFQHELLEEYGRRDCEYEPQTHEHELNAQTNDYGSINGGEEAPEEEMGDTMDQYEVSRKDVLDYLCNKRKLAPEMDQIRKKERISHRKCKERVGSEPILDELAALIQRVAEGSKIKHRYIPGIKRKVTSKSALGWAFDHLGKRQHHDLSDSDPESPNLSSDD
ncbi:hypothetical protein C0993_011419 [Termitomyces sp. T159_Od127]|nr:hypothetical protein C0993_011419 [Termitomyces sp. T159_Od127]